MKDAPRPSAKKLTMQDVAAVAGVSPMTVSNCFRYPERVQDTTRAAVLEVAANLGYVPNMSAGLLATGTSRVIGAVLPSVRNSSFYNYTLGLRDAAAARGHRLITMIAETPEEELSAVQTLLGLRVAGIALVAGPHAPALRQLLDLSGMPAVESWGGADAIGCGVGYDVGAASRELTQHLIAQGRRRIGFVDVSGGGGLRYSMRLPAFRQEMFAAGLSDALVLKVRAADGFGAGGQIVDEFLAQEPRLDAILCPSDVVAAGAVFACNRRGLSVPDEIAVAGWGDYDIGRQLTPSLTTIAPFSDEIGVGAIRALLDGARTETRVQTRFALLVRESA
ncbi:LacI family transcriptional regulator [Pseudooceanicola sediminis]|uniref:LacI family transcriptional regulator n=1 Tax=Pseudooceanicola sediminis TaxID=2211117 RepID=A0A399J0R8_9RHOB|nr:LacI family DNA-binding transcriptional regulator [Pseudooceanicola sediminis]KAA2312413.1 LacI family transcriptional regulator [Puniceibacterium sp. HSS470]RII37462.1 LacI family transcriptional regulator [Pseudooceanicola sediminis]|tara:strand:- start:6425 stop:7429 length:1005 start_codon:yes stop_codon:yes gene_type:complete